MNIRRGEVHLIDFSNTNNTLIRGKHPGIIISNNSICRNSNVVQCIPITSTMKYTEASTHYVIPKGQCGLIKDSLLLCEQIASIDKNQIINKLGYWNNSIREFTSKALVFLLGINVENYIKDRGEEMKVKYGSIFELASGEEVIVVSSDLCLRYSDVINVVPVCEKINVANDMFINKSDLIKYKGEALKAVMEQIEEHYRNSVNQGKIDINTLQEYKKLMR